MGRVSNEVSFPLEFYGMFKEELETDMHKNLGLSVIKQQLGQRNGFF